ncbi:PH domain-containing protein [Candidatus Micrarchaeota archaeon]|nr:PH domain-containing protein [Candidatus Micrarchaeota archaeon]
METETFHPTAKPEHVKTLLIAITLTLIALFFQSFLGSIATFFLSVIWIITILISIIVELRTRAVTINLEEKGISVKQGILNTKQVFINYSNIANINIHRSLFERMVGVGSLEIDTAGTSGAEVLIHSIDNKYLQKVIELAKKGGDE